MASSGYVLIDSANSKLCSGVTIDTTTAQNTSVSFVWNEANASDLFTVNQAYVQCIEPNR